MTCMRLPRAFPVEPVEKWCYLQNVYIRACTSENMVKTQISKLVEIEG